jgi:LmbE family N-acetylglucosaminyl deacetylase
MKNIVLVVAAHPDDELLGLGGTLIKRTQAGDEVFCLILGEGILSRKGSKRRDVQLLKQDSRNSGKILGFKKMFFSNFPDNKFDSVNLLMIVKEIEKYIENIDPDIIYTHYENDLNIDHRLTFTAVMTACRPCNKNGPNEIYTFETPSSTEWQSKQIAQFSPNVYIDIENFIDKKIEALKKYKSEIKNYPHPRSVQGIKILAAYRGLECGLKFAEAFCMIRNIQRS